MDTLSREELVNRSKDVFSHKKNEKIHILYATEDGCFFDHKNFLNQHVAKMKKHGEDLKYHEITRAEAMEEGEPISKEVGETKMEVKQSEEKQPESNNGSTDEQQRVAKSTETAKK